jgi:PKD repeat protein
MKKIIGFGILILILVVSGRVVLGETLVQSKTLYSVQDVSLSVSQYNEERVVIFPEKPLQFKSTVIWVTSYEKKWTMATSKKASVKIDIIDANGKEHTVELFYPGEGRSGSLDLPPGQRCRVTLFAGKYSNLFKRYGANLNAICKYQSVKVQVNAVEMNDMGRFKLNVESIPAANWIWTLPDGKQLTNNSTETTFPGGLAIIKLSSFPISDSFQFDLQVPEPLEAKPGMTPTEGYEDLTVHGFADLTSHYQSTSNCSWDFGDGSPVQTGAALVHIYRQPGIYQARLTITNSLGPVIEKDWEIKVQPFTIKNDAIVSPGRGPIPYSFFYHANPVILGTEPTSFQYFWDFGDGFSSRESSGEHIYRKVGDYTVQLRITDNNHPDLRIESWTYTVTITPPVLNLTIDASRWSGSIPLRVDFRSNLIIEGGPTDVEYYWDFNDGITSYEKNPTHIFIDPGHYEVRLMITDRVYGTIVTKRIHIEVKPPLLNLAVFASDNYGIIPFRAIFTPVLKIEGGPTDIEYIWDFNDGTFDKSFASLPVRHTYYQPGVYTVNITARDRIYHTVVTTQVTIEAKPPVVASRSAIVPFSGTAPLRISGAGNADVKGYPSRLEYTWYVDGQMVSVQRDFSYVITVPGTHKVTVTIVDVLPGHTGRDSQSWNVLARGNPKPTPVVVIPTRIPVHTPAPTPVPTPPLPAATATPVPVKDTTPPQLTVSLSPNRLRSPNHKLIQVTAVIQADDDRDPDPVVRLVSITCNQTIDPASDIGGASFGTDDRSFYLRAERDGNQHEDRIYMVTYSATDHSGNSKTVTATVVVPFNDRDDRDNRDENHDRGEKHNNR